MSNTLTKDLGATLLSPAVPGTPGVAPTPAYCVTTTKTEMFYPVIYITKEDGTVVAMPGSSYPVTTSTTTCYPATPGVAPTPGVPATVAENFNLGWNAGARSIATLSADGAAKFSVGGANIGAVVGLHTGLMVLSFSAISRGLYFRAGLVSVVESGVERTGAVAYLEADVFRVERSGSTVRYYQNNTLLYTSADPSYGEAYLVAVLYSGGDTVLSPAIEPTVTAGHGGGGAVLRAVAALGGILLASGAAMLGPIGAAGSGHSAQGGAAVLAAMGSVGSQGAYAAGSATLAPLGARGEAGMAPIFALGVAQLGYIGAVGYGVTASMSLHPAKSLGDNTAAWPEQSLAGYTVSIVSGTGAGQSQLIADNSGQALLFNDVWATIPDATSYYEIRDTLGNVLASGYVTPATSAMRTLTAHGANYAYAGGRADLRPLGSYGAAQVIDWADTDDVVGVVLASSPLGACRVLGLHDFTGQLGDALSYFVLDLVSADGAVVRVPMSSWQATLQTGSSNYVQCVVPACAPWLDVINAATEFVIYRQAVAANGVVVEYEITRAPPEQVQYDRGPQRYTCTLSGYTDAFAEDDNPSAAFDRTLTGVRSVSSGSALRVRCAMDWLLRPGHRAFVHGTPFVVRYINYYAPSNFDAYMDVGS